MASRADSRELGAGLRALRARLRDAGYDAEWLRRRLGAAVPDDVGLLNRAPALQRLHADRSPAACLARLFYLEAPETARAAGAALAGLSEALRDVRLLRRRGDTVRAALRIDAFGGLHLLADRRMERPDRVALGLPAGDMVYPVGSDSALLAGAVPAREGAQALDLCCGTGVQGLILAATARRVIGVDVGPRAVALARRNALLNGVTRFEVRRGDLFAPVRGERFDLIVANPPFVSSPHRGPAYHSGGRLGDRVLRRIVAGLGDHLARGGRAFAVSHVALRGGEDVASRLRVPARAFPGRVLALVLERGTIVDLAAAQAVFALERGLRAYAAEVERWTAFLRRVRVEQIVLVLLALERSGRRRLDIVEAPQRVLPLPLSRPPAEHVRDWLG